MPGTSGEFFAVGSEAVARPNTIWVYDFVATPGEVPGDASIKNDVGAPSTPPTAEEIASATAADESINAAPTNRNTSARRRG